MQPETGPADSSAGASVPISRRCKPAAALLAAEAQAAAAECSFPPAPPLSSGGGGGGYLTFSFDLEATGLDVLTARILDIAVVDVESGR